MCDSPPRTLTGPPCLRACCVDRQYPTLWPGSRQKPPSPEQARRRRGGPSNARCLARAWLSLGSPIGSPLGSRWWFWPCCDLRLPTVTLARLPLATEAFMHEAQKVSNVVVVWVGNVPPPAYIRTHTHTLSLPLSLSLHAFHVSGLYMACPFTSACPIAITILTPASSTPSPCSQPRRHDRHGAPRDGEAGLLLQEGPQRQETKANTRSHEPPRIPGHPFSGAGVTTARRGDRASAIRQTWFVLPLCFVCPRQGIPRSLPLLTMNCRTSGPAVARGLHQRRARRLPTSCPRRRLCQRRLPPRHGTQPQQQQPCGRRSPDPPPRAAAKGPPELAG